jgi:AraC-like DNA-binding protein
MNLMNDTQIVYSKQGAAYCSWMPSFCHFAPPAYNCEMNAPRQMPAITFSAVLAGLQALGFNSDALLDSLGVSRAQFEDPFGTIPETWLEGLFEWARARDPRPDLPARVGLATPFGMWGLIDYLVGSAETLGADLIALSLFFHLVLRRTRLELAHGGDFIWFVNQPRLPTDWMTEQLGLGVMVGRQTGFCPQFRVARFYIKETDRDTATHLENLFQTPVERGAPHAGMCLMPGIWNARIQTADPSLHATLKTLAQRVEVKAFETAPLAFAVRSQLADAVSAGQFSAGQIAEQLGLPLRTFQRRLSEEQVSFQDLLDAYRQSQAMKMLAHENVTMAEVAYALGYNEQSSFNRAFKRWTGKTPRAWLAEKNAA